MLRCRNLEASRGFYVGLLGLEVVKEWDQGDDRGCIVGFGPGGGFLEMLAVDSQHSKHRPAFEEPVANDKIELQIRVESVDAWARQLDGRVKIEGPVTRPWGNRYLWVRDPDGVRVAFFEGPDE